MPSSIILSWYLSLIITVILICIAISVCFSRSSFVTTYLLTPLRDFFHNCNGKILHKIHNTKIDCDHIKKKLISTLITTALMFIFIVIFLQLLPKIVSYTQIDYFISYFFKLTPYLTPGSILLTRGILSFFGNTKIFTIESPNSKTLFIIAMLLHALFVYIFILLSIYTIFMSTNTVMFTYLTIAYEIISEIFWWFIDNYILAPCPFLEDSDDDYNNHEEQELSQLCLVQIDDRI